MREKTQEAILSAYITSVGKRGPRQAADDAAEICTLARSLHRLNEAACKGGLDDRQEKRMSSLQKTLQDALDRAGLTLNHFENDPRSYAVYINLPDGFYNSFGGEENGYGIG